MAAVKIALSTIDDGSVARTIARRLVDERLAACVNLVPGCTSIYRWEGEVHEEEEILLVIKTSSERLPALKERLIEIHPYDVPEFVVLDVGSGSEDYLNWVIEETR